MIHRCGQEVTDVSKHECPGRAETGGRTLAEAVGLEIPASAPGGQKIAPPTLPARVSPSERASRGVDLGYDGFVDRDAWT